MTSRTRLTVLLVTAPVLAFALVGGALGKVATSDETIRPLRVFQDVVLLISNNYVEQANMDKVMRGAMRGLADGLDPDSAYLTEDEVKAVESKEALPAGETGIELTRQFYLRIISVRDGSPAHRAGLRAGDFIRGIDNTPTREMSAFTGTRLLRGPVGSKVNLVILRGSAADPHPVELTREPLASPDVTSRMEAGNLGYVRVVSFGASVPKALPSEVQSLVAKGATGVVIDLRDNAMGGMENGLAAARAFVRSGTLVLKDTKGAARETIAAAPGDGRNTTPLVLLVDQGTSGAAELFAAALAGNKRATLVGERTHGRAAMQKLVRLPDGTGMLISNAWYLTPAGEPIHEKGLVPTVAVEGPEIEFGAAVPAADPVLEKGLEQLRGAK